MNKKVSGLISIFIAAFFLSACSGDRNIRQAAFDCVFPDAPGAAAPGWICDEPVEGISVSAVGSAQKSAAGQAFMKQMATTAARVELASNMKVHVSNLIKQYVETTGAASTETVDMVNSSVSKQITNEDIVGSRLYKSRVSPNGTLYVLVGIDEGIAQQVTEKALRTSMNNERALWQQFKASKGQEELAAAIAASGALRH